MAQIDKSSPARPRRAVRHLLPSLLLAVALPAIAAREIAEAAPPEARSAAAAGVFGGIVVDSADQPIPLVEVTITALGLQAFTDEAGVFQLAAIPAGTHEVIVRKLGWRPITMTRVFAPSDTVSMRFVLVRLTVLEAREIRATELRMRDFEEHRRLKLGHFITREEIERNRPVQTSQLLNGVRGLRVYHDRHGNVFAMRSRGRTSLSGTPCGPARPADVWIDNVPVYRFSAKAPPFNINSLDPRHIIGIEYYSGPSQTPVQFQNLDSVCGVLVIWTSR